MGALGGCCACICGLVCAALPIVFTVYLGIYAFNNPDKDAWYGIVSEQKALFATHADGKTAQAAELVDIHQRFVTWFLWGFIQTLAPIAVGLISAIGTAINPTCGSALAGVGGCAMGCGGLAWWITGIVWRFRSDGAYSVGDIPEGDVKPEEWEKTVTGSTSLFQHHSGMFMFVYYMICWSSMVLSLLCGLGVSIYGCIKAKAD